MKIRNEGPGATFCTEWLHFTQSGPWITSFAMEPGATLINKRLVCVMNELDTS